MSKMNDQFDIYEKLSQSALDYFENVVGVREYLERAFEMLLHHISSEYLFASVAFLDNNGDLEVLPYRYPSPKTVLHNHLEAINTDLIHDLKEGKSISFTKQLILFSRKSMLLHFGNIKITTKEFFVTYDLSKFHFHSDYQIFIYQNQNVTLIKDMEKFLKVDDVEKLFRILYHYLRHVEIIKNNPSYNPNNPICFYAIFPQSNQLEFNGLFVIGIAEEIEENELAVLILMLHKVLSETVKERKEIMEARSLATYGVGHFIKNRLSRHTTSIRNNIDQLTEEKVNIEQIKLLLEEAYQAIYKAERASQILDIMAKALLLLQKDKRLVYLEKQEWHTNTVFDLKYHIEILIQRFLGNGYRFDHTFKGTFFNVEPFIRCNNNQLCRPEDLIYEEMLYEFFRNMSKFAHRNYNLQEKPITITIPITIIADEDARTLRIINQIDEQIYSMNPEKYNNEQSYKPLGTGLSLYNNVLETTNIGNIRIRYYEEKVKDEDKDKVNVFYYHELIWSFS